MRTLIVDNYDSFTYNLVHCFAEVGGVEPVVIRNDDAAFTCDELRYYDNVVLSPGPGRPERAADFGICTEIIDAVLHEGALPLLGVCLGHQGLCHLAGGGIAAAGEVRHGRSSLISHDGHELFAGLPSPFSAVRYHSLAAARLPRQLVATAHSEDGEIMAVRHTRQPAWGVQFHPESICTEYGAQLLSNFTRLTEQWRVKTNRQRRPARHRAAPPPASPPAPTTLRLLATRIATPLAAERVFSELFASQRHAYWLDSSDQTGSLGRFSMMGDAGGPLGRVVTADTQQRTVQVTSGGNIQTVHSGFFDWLQRDLAALEVDTPPTPFDFALGWVGYLGYELKAECGGAAAHRSPYPDAALVFSDRGLVFDHQTNEVYLLALASPKSRPGSPETMPGAQTWLRETAARLWALAARSNPDPQPPATPSSALTAPLSLRHDRARYLDLIEACQRAIRLGETYEVCLTNMVTGRTGISPDAAGTQAGTKASAEKGGAALDPLHTYRFLRQVSPAPFSALLRLGDLSVLSTSPERFLRATPDGGVESRPIKGTRRRAATASEDEELRHDLRYDEKDRAENLMITDLIRNDLGSCAEPGSVHVPELFAVESYAAVHQLVSTVRARLRTGVSVVECIRAAFPGGSMTGAPKLRTMQLLDEFEGAARGVYSGALGYLSPNGALDLSMVIRTLIVEDDAVSFGVGGAITALSIPLDEFAETELKAAAMLRLFSADFPSSTPAPLTGAGLAGGSVAVSR